MKLINTQTGLKQSYNRLYGSASGKLLVKTGAVFNNWVLSILRPNPETRLFDISCGKGYFLESAITWTPYAYGGDISELAVSEAGKLVPDSLLTVTNSEILPYRNNSFDIITSLGSLEHYLNPDEALMEFSRCLKPGGQLFIFVPNGFYIGYFWNVFRKGKGPSHDQDLERFEALDFWIELISQEFRIELISKYNPGTGVSFGNAVSSCWNLIKQGSILQGLRYLWVNLAFRLIPLNVSKYFGFLCSPVHAKPVGRE